MKFFYDLHIHSDLSPCADKDMTPNNIVNMAYIKGLNIISVTDHNSVKNYPAIKKVAQERNIELIPAMEISSKEEVHLLCYFKNYNDAEKVDKIIYDSLPDIKNKAEIFGEQNIINEKDEVIGQVDKLLLNSSNYSISEIFDIVKKNGGIVIPAHVDRQSFGILGVLGFIPEELNINYIEVHNEKIIDEKILNKFKILKNSDAHRLSDISESVNFLEAEDIKKIYAKFFRG